MIKFLFPFFVHGIKTVDEAVNFVKCTEPEQIPWMIIKRCKLITDFNVSVEQYTVFH